MVDGYNHPVEMPHLLNQLLRYKICPCAYSEIHISMLHATFSDAHPKQYEPWLTAAGGMARESRNTYIVAGQQAVKHVLRVLCA